MSLSIPGEDTGGDILRHDGIGDLQVRPELNIKLLHSASPFHVGLYHRRLTSLRWWRWQTTLGILQLHQGGVNILNLSEHAFAIARADARSGSSPFAWQSEAAQARSLANLPALNTLDVEKRLRRLRVTEGDFTQATLEHKLLILRFGLHRRHGTLDLLLHPLHMVIARSIEATAPGRTWTPPRLEKVRLREVTEWLMGVLSRSTADLAVHLIIEVFRHPAVTLGFIRIARGRHQLLELNPSDEVLILGCHKPITSGQQKNLVIPLCALGILHEKRRALFLR